MSARALPLAGMLAGPLAWAVNTQLGEILPYVECGSRWQPSLLLSALALVLSLGAAWLSWRAPGFVARISAGVGLAFGFALLLQAAAGAMLSGCER